MRAQRWYSRAVLLVACPMLFFATACSDQGERVLSEPVFDARAPFPELSSGGGASSGARAVSAKKEASEFERAIADSMAGGADEDTPDDAPASAAVQTQKVTLPGGLASTIPLDFDAWQWSSEGGVTVITHRAAGATSPDAMIYAERFGELARVYPSREMTRFRVFADPAFTPLFGGLEENIEGALKDETPEVPLDYRSSRDSFSGWRWFGQNPADVTLRFGRTQGRWSAPESGAEGEGAVTSSAWMLLGSANLGGGLGAHIAIICKQSPRCPVAEELSEFLAEMAPASGIAGAE